MKAEVVRACGAPGASIAAIALSHGINANIVHRWVRERGESVKQQDFLPVPISPASSGAGDAAGQSSRLNCGVAARWRRYAHPCKVPVHARRYYEIGCGDSKRCHMAGRQPDGYACRQCHGAGSRS
ncbi:transposase [Achromobacter sp. JUb104]|uniref:transposase n=1 Tax=Achromobacter sp. JUb104 TaxID=2940590 RepID=UPI00286E09C2|nr:transposase [Achromobacter sp. JUb104]